MRRRGRGGGIRAEYLADLERMERLYGGPEFGHPFAAQITALKAGKPVVVAHGWQIDLPPGTGSFCLEPDGTITAVEPVYRDPAAVRRTVVRYRRPDGTMVCDLGTRVAPCHAPNTPATVTPGQGGAAR